ncbi:MAG: hypothetical protein U0176_20705 [Bacteroidia bacterium]
MGIKVSEDLFQLIRSMSPAEKRAFKLLSERHERQSGNNYIQLFDAIAAQESFDEEALRQQFAGRAFLRNFSEAKAYLYRILLRSLRFSQGPDAPETELREMLDHLEILHAKGLSSQAEKQAKAGLEKAQKLDLHAFSFEFHKWRRRLAKQRGGKGLQENLAKIGAEEATALACLQVEAELRDRMGRIQVMLQQQVDLRDQAHSQALEEIWGHPVFQTPPTAAGFHALLSYYHGLAYYHHLKHDWARSCMAWESVVGTFEAFPVHIQHTPDQYINALVTLLDARLTLRQFDAFQAELPKLQAQHVAEAVVAARAALLGQHLTLRWALISGHLDEGLRNLPTLEAAMVKHKKYMSVSLEMSLLFNICSLFFLTERYPEAQRYINAVLNRPHLPIREDLVDALRLLELVGRYARGQMDLLEHLLKAQERRLRQVTTKPAFLVTVVKAFHRLMDAADAAETRQLQAELLRELESMPAEARISGHEELYWWARSRVEGRSIHELLLARTDEDLGDAEQCD